MKGVNGTRVCRVYPPCCGQVWALRGVRHRSKASWDGGYEPGGVRCASGMPLRSQGTGFIGVGRGLGCGAGQEGGGSGFGAYLSDGRGAASSESAGRPSAQSVLGVQGAPGGGDLGFGVPLSRCWERAEA